MCIKKKSTTPDKGSRVLWTNIRVAYCLACRKDFHWRTKRCPGCQTELVQKVKRKHVQEE